jgi:hypothetical protein
MGKLSKLRRVATVIARRPRSQFGASRGESVANVASVAEH